jgi:ribulose-phosphate 3-epimerase
MILHLGVKSDAIESRYSFDWLFDVMKGCGVHRMQMGTSFPVFLAADEHFTRLRHSAEAKGIGITSMFTSHRELGFAHADPLLDDAVRRGWEKAIHVAALVGAESVGSNACIVLRDQPQTREPGLRTFMANMKELLVIARRAGLKALTLEPMSSLYELPSTPEEVRSIAEELGAWHSSHAESTVPLHLCGDISHGIADSEGRVVHDNWSLFEMQIPWMREFHFKNTDAIFNSTFGFSPEECSRGIVDLGRLKGLIDANAGRFPCGEVTGYLEIGGPKLGREYSDMHLERMLVESLQALKAVFDEEERAS